MPRYSEPSAYPRSIEVLGEHGLDLVAVMQRGASVGHDDFALVEAFKNFRRGVGHQSHPNLPGLHRIPFDHLNGQMVNGGTRNRDAAAALGGEAGAPIMVLTSVTSPAAGARNDVGADRAPPAGAPGCCGGGVSRASS